MPFPSSVAEQLLVACHRHCCICHKPTGNKMEIDHIVPHAEGGPDTADNGIPLCFDCHAEVHAYNPNHPRGRRFTPSELRRHRDQWFAICSSAPWHESLRRDIGAIAEPVTLDDQALDAIQIDEPKLADRLALTIAQQRTAVQSEWMKRITQHLYSQNEDTRWKAAAVIEALVGWMPRLVPIDLLEHMAQDAFFGVRSFAARCFYHLAAIEPAAVPVFVLAQLAAYDEDWYVTTPATSAMLRLARARPVVLDLLARELSSTSRDAREHAASAIRRLATKDWDLLTNEVVKGMKRSKDPFVKAAGIECAQIMENGWKGPRMDYYTFDLR